MLSPHVQVHLVKLKALEINVEVAGLYKIYIPLRLSLVLCFIFYILYFILFTYSLVYTASGGIKSSIECNHVNILSVLTLGKPCRLSYSSCKCKVATKICFPTKSRNVWLGI